MSRTDLTRRRFLGALGAGAASLALPSWAEERPSRPLNILFLFADQMHGFAMGCMGHPQVRTPHLDRLAAEGTLFRNCYSCAPVCTPFRGTLFTGRYGSQTNTLRNEAPLPRDRPALAESLNEAGYRTSYIGKWHLGGAGNRWIPPELRGGFTDFIGYQCYNDYLNNVLFFDEEGKQIAPARHRTDATTDLAVQRLERLAGERFALFVSYQNPHYPEQPSPEYEAMYAGMKIQRRPNCRAVEPYTATISPPSPKPRTEDPVYRKYGGDLDEYLRLYYAMLTQLDAGVGRLMAALDRLGLRDNTVVFFTSDHGDMQGSHGRTNKAVPWEESTRIPLIVRAPGGPRGRSSDALISSVDFYPTCLEYAGARPRQGLEGAGFASLVRGGTAPAERPIFSEMPGWCLVRQGRHKLVARRPALEPTHLFDIEADPYEMRNLVQDAGAAGVREKLLGTLRDWNARVTAGRARPA